MQTFITHEQDYALRIVAMLAGLTTGEHLSIKELSNRLLISKNFAARIAHKLKNAEVIGTNQGVTGGIFLKKDPTQLSVYDVLNVIGFRSKFNLCLDDSFECGLNAFCRFHKLFDSIENNIYTILKEKKISEFIISLNNKTINKLEVN